MWSWVWTYKYAEDTQISNNILCTYKLVNNIQQMPRMYYAYIYIYIYIYILRKVVCLSCRVDQISQTMAAPTTLLGTIGKCLIDEEEVGVDCDGGFCNVTPKKKKKGLFLGQKSQQCFGSVWKPLDDWDLWEVVSLFFLIPKVMRWGGR